MRYSVSAEITPHARELSTTTAEKLASSRDGFASRFHFFLQIYYLGHAIAPGRFALDLAVSLRRAGCLDFRPVSDFRRHSTELHSGGSS